MSARLSIESTLQWVRLLQKILEEALDGPKSYSAEEIRGTSIGWFKKVGEVIVINLDTRDELIDWLVARLSSSMPGLRQGLLDLAQEQQEEAFARQRSGKVLVPSAPSVSWKAPGSPAKGGE